MNSKGRGEALEGAQSGKLHLMASGDEAGAKGRRGPHVPLGTDSQYCNSHLGLTLSALPYSPQLKQWRESATSEENRFE
jgi:hypothetical protein